MRTYNLTVCFERDGFEAHVSPHRRRDLIGEFGNLGARAPHSVVGATIRNAQISDSASSNGLALRLQATHLTKETSAPAPARATGRSRTSKAPGRIW